MDCVQFDQKNYWGLVLEQSLSLQVLHSLVIYIFNPILKIESLLNKLLGRDSLLGLGGEISKTAFAKEKAPLEERESKITNHLSMLKS